MKNQFKSVRKVLSSTVIAAIIATSVTPAYAASSYTTYVNASKATNNYIKAGLPKKTADEKRIASLETTARKEVAKLTSQYRTKKSQFSNQINSQHNKVVSYEASEDKAEKSANDAIKAFQLFEGRVTAKTSSSEVTAQYNAALKVINSLKYSDVKSTFTSKLNSIKSEITKKIAGLQVVSISNINDIKVNGEEKVVLPKTVAVTLANGSKVTKSVQWNQTNFSKAGTYTVYGTVTDTTKKATVKVVVAGPVMISNSKDYVQAQDFEFTNEYDAGYFAYNVGFNLDENKLPYNKIADIKISLVDENGNTIATKTATGSQIEQLEADGGMISTEFVQSDEVESDDFWTSSAYDLSTPSKVVIQITDKNQNIYTVENRNPIGIPNSVTLASQNGTSSYPDIQAAVNAAQDGDMIYIPKGTYELNNQIRIEKALTLIGAGDSTVIKKGSTPWTNTTGTKGYASLITVKSEDNAVKLQNITVTGAANITMTGSGSGTDYGSGINVVSSSDVTLNNITSTNNAAAGLIVNSSNVTANNFNTSGNSWYGVNVDKSASGDASFKLTGKSVISEATPILSDKTSNVTVEAEGYTPYAIEGTTVTVWNNKAPENFIKLTNARNTSYYSNLVTAVNAAQDGDTIKVPVGTYKLNSQLRIEKSITIIGAGDSTVITKGTTPWSNATGTKGYASLITVNSSDKVVTLENLKVTGAANITMTGSGSGTDYGSGINVVSSTNVTLNNITSANNAAAGLIVNSSNVTANNFNTSGNSWYGVNVDKSASGDASFTLTGNGVISETTPIMSDKSTNVTVDAKGYTAYTIEGTTTTLWNKKVPENYITISNSNRLYSNLETAVNAAQDGDTIKVPAGTYKLNSQLRFEKSITIIGAGDSTIITKGTTPWANTTGTKGYASLITVNSGDKAVTLENLKITGAANIIMTGSGTGTDYGSGINVVSSSNVKLNNITLTDNAAAGLIVNSSNVTANNLNTSGNGWYGVNVDKKASGNASFTLTGDGVIGENTKIYSESPANVNVNAQGYHSSEITGGAMVWTK